MSISFPFTFIILIHNLKKVKKKEEKTRFILGINTRYLKT
jgi:hypothetical protein